MVNNANIWGILMVNVTIYYIAYMDPMGIGLLESPICWVVRSPRIINQQGLNAATAHGMGIRMFGQNII